MVASDECYLSSAGRRRRSRCFLSVCDGDDNVARGALAVETSNLAGYRAGFVAGDPALVDEVARRPQARRHDRARAGPGGDGPRLDDEAHARAEGARYARRGSAPPGLLGAGFHLRPLRGRPVPVGDPRRGLLGHGGLARRPGILAAPGAFYGPAGESHVRLALTASDERIAAAVARLAA